MTNERRRNEQINKKILYNGTKAFAKYEKI